MSGHEQTPHSIRPERLEEANQEAEEKLPSFAELILSSGEILGDAEGARHLSQLNTLMIGFHNSTINPLRLTLNDFTEKLVVLPKYQPTLPDPNAPMVTREAALMFYLKRNGKEEFFSVQKLYDEPLNMINTIVLTFK